MKLLDDSLDNHDESTDDVEGHDDHSIDDHSIEVPESSAWGVALFLFGTLWAVASSFSVLFGAYTMHLQVGPILALGLLTIALCGRGMFSTITNPGVMAVMTYSTASVVSFAASSNKDIAGLGRTVLLAPVVWMLCTIQMRDAEFARRLRLGLATGCLLFLAYCAARLNVENIADTKYRLSETHPNHVGAVAAAAGLVFLAEFLHAERIQSLFGVSVLLGHFLAMGSLVLTKSRTALVSFVASAIVLALLQRARGHLRLVMLGVLAAGLVMTALGPKRTMEVLVSINDKDRDIMTLTNRTSLWERGWELFREQPILGNGPGANRTIFEWQYRQYDCHNGLLGLLIDVGLAGTLPMLVLLWICTRSSFQRFGRVDSNWSISMFCAQVIHSLSEGLFFSMGTPSGLLRLCANAELSAPLSERRTSQSREEELADGEHVSSQDAELMQRIEQIRARRAAKAQSDSSAIRPAS